MVLLHTGAPGTSREINSEDADGENRGVASLSLTMENKSIAQYLLLGNDVQAAVLVSKVLKSC